jgi:predicted metalloprotease with PDZ domain
VRTRSDGKDLVVTHVLEGSEAQAAGLAAGDVMVALDGLRPGRDGLDAMLAERRPGGRLTVHAFRRDELMSFDVRTKRPPADTCVLTESSRGSRRRLLERWLGKRRG